MKRARHPLSTMLRRYLNFNSATGYYEITQEDITYHLTMNEQEV